ELSPGPGTRTGRMAGLPGPPSVAFPATGQTNRVRLPGRGGTIASAPKCVKGTPQFEGNGTPVVPIAQPGSATKRTRAGGDGFTGSTGIFTWAVSSRSRPGFPSDPRVNSRTRTGTVNGPGRGPHPQPFAQGAAARRDHQWTHLPRRRCRRNLR